MKLHKAWRVTVHGRDIDMDLNDIRVQTYYARFAKEYTLRRIFVMREGQQ